jgi:hypothetical protein
LKSREVDKGSKWALLRLLLLPLRLLLLLTTEYSLKLWLLWLWPQLLGWWGRTSWLLLLTNSYTGLCTGWKLILW